MGGLKTLGIWFSVFSSLFHRFSFSPSLFTGNFVGLFGALEWCFSLRPTRLTLHMQI